MKGARIGVVCDLEEEGWPSMDLVAEMLLEHLPAAGGGTIEAARIQPRFRARFSDGRMPDEDARARGGSGARKRFNLDRGLNRFGDYPRALREMRDRFDIFHVVDHAYAHLVHALPAERTVVTCHDLHTFQCLLEETGPRRSRPFRWMTRHVLRGLEKAGRVVVDTAAVGEALVAKGIVPPDRVRVAHLGVDPIFSPRPDPAADAAVSALLGEEDSGCDVLHVGGTFARKRLDLVLDIFAAARMEQPRARLIRVGGPLTPEQRRRALELGIEDAIVSLPFIDRTLLAAVYRRATLVILPSEEEGFGFPVLEAMRSGTPVIASDLAVLREVGGEAATYRAVGDVAGWVDAIRTLLRERELDPDASNARRRKGVEHASRFTWQEYARRMVNVYMEQLSR